VTASAISVREISPKQVKNHQNGKNVQQNHWKMVFMVFKKTTKYVFSENEMNLA